MNILQLLSTTLCGALVWIFIVPSRHCPNRCYRILFWIFFVILLLAASVIASAISIHDKWYTQGIAVIICAIISAYTSIQIAPNNYTTATPPINIDDLKYALNNGEHRNRPYFALQITKYYLGKEESQVFSRLLRMSYENMALYSFSRHDRVQIINRILEYYRLHLPEFPEIKSLSVLQALFE